MVVAEKLSCLACGTQRWKSIPELLPGLEAMEKKVMSLKDRAEESKRMFKWVDGVDKKEAEKKENSTVKKFSNEV